MESPEKSSQRREYVRVKDMLRVRYRLLTLEEVQAWHNTITIPNIKRASMENMVQGSMHRSMELQQDLGIPPMLIDLLIGIDSKLDTLLRVVAQPSLANDEYESTGEVEISGSGMCFLTRGEYRRGEQLGVTVTLPTFPPSEVLALATVVRSDLCQSNGGSPAQFSTSVHFDDINEDDRDLLVRYTFQRQREVVRQKNTNV